MVFTAILPLEMPRYYEDDESNTKDDDHSNQNPTKTNIRLWKPLLVLTFFYYLITCGVERIYQPMVGRILNELILFRSCRIVNISFKHVKL